MFKIPRNDNGRRGVLRDKIFSKNFNISLKSAFETTKLLFKTPFHAYCFDNIEAD